MKFEQTWIDQVLRIDAKYRALTEAAGLPHNSDFATLIHEQWQAEYVALPLSVPEHEDRTVRNEWATLRQQLIKLWRDRPHFPAQDCPWRKTLDFVYAQWRKDEIEWIDVKWRWVIDEVKREWDSELDSIRNGILFPTTSESAKPINVKWAAICDAVYAKWKYERWHSEHSEPWLSTEVIKETL